MIATFLLLLIYLAYANLRAYRAFADDKRFAINKEQRTPEAELLRLARIGGWGGAKYAQQKLRHKSYKQPFASQLNKIGALHAATAVTLLTVFFTLAVAPTSPRANKNNPYDQASQTGQALPPQQSTALRQKMNKPNPAPPHYSLRPPFGPDVRIE